MPWQDGKCALWGVSARIEHHQTRDEMTVDSTRAGGKYSITGSAKQAFIELHPEKKAIVKFWMVKQRSLGVERPCLDTSALTAILAYPKPTAYERAEYLLRYIERKSSLLGEVLKFYAQDNIKNQDPNIAPEILAWTCSLVLLEVITLIEYCAEEGWLEHNVTPRAAESANEVHHFTLKPKGYARLAELRGANSASKQGFVAMWFHASVNAVYTDAIEPAIREAGYSPLRIDQRDHVGKVDDEIIAEIRRSRFIICDFTCEKDKPRGNVYYEAGFAKGLNIPVIWTVRADSLSDLQFDTRQFNHIVWNDLADLKKQLQRRIEAVIGDGPLKR